MTKVTQIIAVFCLLVSAKSGASVVARPAIVPQPAKLTVLSGTPLTIASGAVVSIDAQDLEAKGIAEYLRDLTRRSTGLQLAISTDASANSQIKFEKRSGFAAEGYRLDVDSKSATITASTRAGLFYGAVTLWQLLTSDPSISKARVLAPVRIEDQPAYQWRGFLLSSLA